jgi:hypothetical protein
MVVVVSVTARHRKNFGHAATGGGHEQVVVVGGRVR